MDVRAVAAVRAGAGAEPEQPSAHRAAQTERTERAAAVPAAAVPAAADPPPDVQAAFATSQYLVELLVAQQTGGAPGPPTRPAHITPERLSGLVEFLESHVGHAAGAQRASTVDASG